MVSEKMVNIQLERISNENYDEMDIRFTDLKGYWRHMTVPAAKVDEELFHRGVGFDGSSLAAMTHTENGDLVLRPDPMRVFEDSFTDRKTIVIFADIVDPSSGQAFNKDPRGIARRAAVYLRDSGIATHSYWAPEFEFYVFDEANFWSERGSQGYQIGSIENPESSRLAESKGFVHPCKSAYNMMYPVDSLHDIRSGITEKMQKAGIQVKYHHHEVGRMGQSEVEVSFVPLLSTADNIMLTKHIVRNIALKNGLSATFMPKPLEGEPGSGMHFHMFMTDKQKRIFFDEDGYCGLSKPALNAIAGILHHAPAVCAFSNATVNSYHRLVPGQEAPVYRFFSGPNRSAAIRIPSYAETAETMRFEYRVPDGSSNPYLSISAMLMAAIDGMKKGMDPEEYGYGPIDENVFSEGYNTDKLQRLPANLGEALDALETDRSFLEEGEVFSKDMIDDYVEMKRNELAEFQGSPHPKEHSLYFSL